MSDPASSSGRTSGAQRQQPPLARWNPTRDCWETTQQGSLFSEHSDVFSETWPASGMTRNGTAYAYPTSVAVTTGSESSSLPTPTARDWKDSTIRREPHRPDDTDNLSRSLAVLAEAYRPRGLPM